MTQPAAYSAVPGFNGAFPQGSMNPGVRPPPGLGQFGMPFMPGIATPNNQFNPAANVSPNQFQQAFTGVQNSAPTPSGSTNDDADYVTLLSGTRVPAGNVASTPPVGTFPSTQPTNMPTAPQFQPMGSMAAQPNWQPRVVKAVLTEVARKDTNTIKVDNQHGVRLGDREWKFTRLVVRFVRMSRVLVH